MNREEEEVISVNIGGFAVTDTRENCRRHALMSGRYQLEVDPAILARFIILPIPRQAKAPAVNK